MASRSAPQYRWFGMILYPDNPDHMFVLDFIQKTPILFPSYLFIRHLPEDWIEEMDPDIKADDVDIAAEDLLTRGEKKVHYHVCVKASRACSEASMMMKFGIKDENGRKKSLVSYVPYLRDPEQYFLYTLHWDMDSIKKGKHKYSIDEMHGDHYIIGKLGAHNTNFVLNGMNLINKWILVHPHASQLEFSVWSNSLHNKDPVAWHCVTEAIKANKYMISSSIKDWKFNARDYAEFPEEFFEGKKQEISSDEAKLLFDKIYKLKG